MEDKKLIIDMLNSLKVDLTKQIDKFNDDNSKQHTEIIKRQDYTNGSIGKLKRSQLILRTVLATAFILLAVLGLLPERIYQIITRAL